MFLHERVVGRICKKQRKPAVRAIWGTAEHAVPNQSVQDGPPAVA